MVKKIIENANQVTPEWLSALLKDRGLLPQGQVRKITVGEAQPAFGSAIWRMQAEYSRDASPGAPRRLFLKCANPSFSPGDFNPRQLEKEITFYKTAAPLMNAPFIIPVYDVAYQTDTGFSHLLMKDVSDDHVECLDPTRENHWEKAADVLAQLHAFWWDHPLLGKKIGRYPTAAERSRNIEETRKAATAFMDELGEQLPHAWRVNYEGVLTALPHLFERHASLRNLTLVHGDAHLGNFLFPRTPAIPETYLLDWQFWHPTIGGTDLAFMMATGWETETRRQLESPLIERYHQQLISRGVNSYSLRDCWDDYRLSVILVSIFIPIWRRIVFHWNVDLSTVNRCMTAFEDLHCTELL